MTDHRKHSRYGGSSAPRWMNCAGSVALNDATPAPPAGVYADSGTAKHELAEMCLRRNCHPNAFLGKEMPHSPGFPVDAEMADAVVIYLNALETEIAGSRTSQVFIEQDIAFDVKGAEPGEVFSRLDAAVYHPERARLRIFDFKGGFQDVEPDTAQLKLYAALLLLSKPDWKIREIICTIVQPGSLGEDVKDFHFDTVELLEFMGDVENAIAASKQPDAPLKVGPWCAKAYCNAFAAGTCPAVDAAAMAGIGMDFGEMKPVSVAEITPDLLPDITKLDLTQLARIIDGLDFLTAWAGRAQQYLEAMVLGGASAPGWKVVDKIGRAKWVDDPAKVAGYLDMLFDIPAEQVMPPKLITITEATTRLKAAGATKEQIEDFKLKFTVKESSGRTIARASDRRPAVDVVAADFAGVKVTAPEAIAAE